MRGNDSLPWPLAVLLVLMVVGLRLAYNGRRQSELHPAMLRECKERFAAARTAADSTKALSWTPPTQVYRRWGLSSTCRMIIGDSVYHVYHRR